MRGSAKAKLVILIKPMMSIHSSRGHAGNPLTLDGQYHQDLMDISLTTRAKERVKERRKLVCVSIGHLISRIMLSFVMSPADESDFSLKRKRVGIVHSVFCVYNIYDSMTLS